MHIIGTLTAAAALAAAPLFATAQEADLTPDQVRGLAVELAQSGNPTQAAGLAQALLARDPNDLGALILLAEISADLGDFAAMADYAARAYALSPDDATTFYTARLTANAYARLEQDTRAQFWLRRARQYAPNAAEAEAVAEDFRFLRQRNPFSYRLRFGLSPSSNINNGSASETTEIFFLGQVFESPLDNEARALSGLEVSASATLTYRLSESQDHLTTARADFSGRTYALSRSARDGLQEDFDNRRAGELALCANLGIAAADCDSNVDPVQTGSDFSDASLSFGLDHAQRFDNGWPALRTSVEIGQSWYGGAAYTRFASLSLQQTVPLSEISALGLSFGYTRTRYLDDPDNEDGSRPNSDALTALSVSYSRVLPSEDILRFTLGGRDSASEFTNRDYRAYSLGVSYEPQDPIFGINFGFGLNVEDRRYDVSALAGGGARNDTITSARITAQLSQFEYYGFQPVVTLDASRARSNIDLFDRDSVAVGFDLVSSF